MWRRHNVRLLLLLYNKYEFIAVGFCYCCCSYSDGAFVCRYASHNQPCTHRTPRITPPMHRSLNHYNYSVCAAVTLHVQLCVCVCVCLCAGFSNRENRFCRVFPTRGEHLPIFFYLRVLLTNMHTYIHIYSAWLLLPFPLTLSFFLKAFGVLRLFGAVVIVNEYIGCMYVYVCPYDCCL